MTTLVVGGDSDIDVLGGRVSVGEGNNGNVDVRSLLNGLGVGSGVGDDDQTGLLERSGDIVGERTGGEATSDGGSTSVGGELEDGTLTVGTGRDDTDVGGVVNGSDDTGGQDNLLPVGKLLADVCWYMVFRVSVPLLRIASFSRISRYASMFPSRHKLKPEYSIKISLHTYQVLPTLMTLTPSARVFQR